MSIFEVSKDVFSWFRVMATPCLGIAIFLIIASVVGWLVFNRPGGDCVALAGIGAGTIATIFGAKAWQSQAEKDAP